MAGMDMGFGNLNQMGTGAMGQINQYLVQNIQTLLAANPNYLTSGIPNKLLSQMWMQPPAKVKQMFDVCFFIIIFLICTKAISYFNLFIFFL